MLLLIICSNIEVVTLTVLSSLEVLIDSSDKAVNVMALLVSVISTYLWQNSIVFIRFSCWKHILGKSFCVKTCTTWFPVLLHWPVAVMQTCGLHWICWPFQAKESQLSWQWASSQMWYFYWHAKWCGFLYFFLQKRHFGRKNIIVSDIQSHRNSHLPHINSLLLRVLRRFCCEFKWYHVISSS